MVKQLRFIWITTLSLLVMTACSNGDELPAAQNSSGNNSQEWLIPLSSVLSGGPGKDGIPSIDSPQFANVSEISYLNTDDLVIGVKVGNEVRAYPHPILDWHEIVNDDVNGLKLAVTYCPLTGTAIGWNRNVEGKTTTFGVSGLLHNSNLLPYDRETDSNWSQMRLDCVNGERIGIAIQVEQLVETTWETWKSLYPDSKVLTTETGFQRSYGVYPYGNYKSTDITNFPLTNEDRRLHLKTRVLGVAINEQARAYPIDLFQGDTTSIINDAVGGTPIVVVGNQTRNFIVAFQRSFNGDLLELSPTEDLSDTAIAQDQFGNRWNIFGEAVSGPQTGQKLQNVTSYIGYWFAWAAFHPDISIYQE